MKNNAKIIKSAKHHWWPESISQRWKDESKFLQKMLHNGSVISESNLKGVGSIENGHSIKFDEELSVWNECFESQFDVVDSKFPEILNWLEGLPRKEFHENLSLKERFLPCQLQSERFDIFLECLLSLVIRSPRFRDSIKENFSLYENKDIPKSLGIKYLTNLNLRDAFESLVEGTGYRGKFLVLFSEDLEFIFGDGFYHNYASTHVIPIEPKIIIPLLPNLCVFYGKPMRYSTEPRLITMELSRDEVEFINKTTMIYSKDFVFYRSIKPSMIKEFECQKFLEYEEDTSHEISFLFETAFVNYSAAC